jgi:hypothetical protein
MRLKSGTASTAQMSPSTRITIVPITNSALVAAAAKK